jgi:protein O-mannosyl-transferase
MQVVASVPRNPQLISPINNMLYAAPDFQSRQATSFYILIQYLQLLIFPHPLTCDYNFSQIPLQRFSNALPLISFVLHAALTVFALIKIRKRNVVAFAILFYLVTLSPVSNIFLIGGASMAERFMYIPSLAFCFLVTFFLFKLLKKGDKATGIKKLISQNPLPVVAILVIVSLYSVKTIARSKYWKDNMTIYSVDVVTSPNSVTANKIFGSSLLERARLIQNPQHKLDTFHLSILYLKKAVEIYPYYTEVYRIVGYAYFSTMNYDSAFYFFKEGLKQKPNDAEMNYNAAMSMINLMKYDEAISILKHLTSVYPAYEEAFYNLALCYTNKGDYANALPNYEKVNQLNPNRADAYFYQGEIYKVTGDATKSAAFYKRAADLGYPVRK